MICSNCGKKNSKNKYFCENCNHNIIQKNKNIICNKIKQFIIKYKKYCITYAILLLTLVTGIFVYNS